MYKFFRILKENFFSVHNKVPDLWINGRNAILKRRIEKIIKKINNIGADSPMIKEIKIWRKVYVQGNW